MVSTKTASLALSEIIRGEEKKILFIWLKFETCWEVLGGLPRSLLITLLSFNICFFFVNRIIFKGKLENTEANYYAKI